MAKNKAVGLLLQQNSRHARPTHLPHKPGRISLSISRQFGIEYSRT